MKTLSRPVGVSLAIFVEKIGASSLEGVMSILSVSSMYCRPYGCAEVSVSNYMREEDRRWPSALLSLLTSQSLCISERRHHNCIVDRIRGTIKRDSVWKARVVDHRLRSMEDTATLTMRRHGRFALLAGFALELVRFFWGVTMERLERIAFDGQVMAG